MLLWSIRPPIHSSNFGRFSRIRTVNGLPYPIMACNRQVPLNGLITKCRGDSSHNCILTWICQGSPTVYSAVPWKLSPGIPEWTSLSLSSFPSSPPNVLHDHSSFICKSIPLQSLGSGRNGADQRIGSREKFGEWQSADLQLTHTVYPHCVPTQTPGHWGFPIGGAKAGLAILGWDLHLHQPWLES